MTDRISPGALWEETIAFVRAELHLLLPVACLGFGVPLVALLLAVPVDQAESGRLVAGPWMLWLVPCGLLSMLGSLAISALALTPGASVAECLRIAMTRLPAGIGLFVLNIALQLVLALPIVGLGQIDAMRTGQPGALAMIGNLAMLAVLIWLFVRLMPIWAYLAARGGSPVAAVRGCFAIGRGQYRTMLLVRVVGAVAGTIALLVLLLPIGVFTALLGKATGATAVAALLSYVLTGLVFSALAGLWTVYVARLYRRLAGSSNGI